MYINQGLSDGDALRRAMLWSCVMLGVSMFFLLGALKYLAAEEGSRLERAKELGEAIS
jgi:hypothetical protein